VYNIAIRSVHVDDLHGFLLISGPFNMKQPDCDQPADMEIVQFSAPGTVKRHTGSHESFYIERYIYKYLLRPSGRRRSSTTTGSFSKQVFRLTDHL
jgi:hypothetical protein